MYDLTNYRMAHPGGSSIILAYAGRDASRIFADEHGAKERMQLQIFYIGDLQGSLPASTVYKAPEGEEEESKDSVDSDLQASTVSYKAPYNKAEPLIGDDLQGSPEDSVGEEGSAEAEISIDSIDEEGSAEESMGSELQGMGI